MNGGDEIQVVEMGISLETTPLFQDFLAGIKGKLVKAVQNPNKSPVKPFNSPIRNYIIGRRSTGSTYSGDGEHDQDLDVEQGDLEIEQEDEVKVDEIPTSSDSEMPVLDDDDHSKIAAQVEGDSSMPELDANTTGENRDAASEVVIEVVQEEEKVETKDDESMESPRKMDSLEIIETADETEKIEMIRGNDETADLTIEEEDDFSDVLATQTGPNTEFEDKQEDKDSKEEEEEEKTSTHLANGQLQLMEAIEAISEQLIPAAAEGTGRSAILDSLDERNKLLRQFKTPQQLSYAQEQEINEAVGNICDQAVGLETAPVLEVGAKANESIPLILEATESNHSTASNEYDLIVAQLSQST